MVAEATAVAGGALSFQAAGAAERIAVRVIGCSPGPFGRANDGQALLPGPGRASATGNRVCPVRRGIRAGLAGARAGGR